MSIKIKNLTVTFKNGVTAIRHADLEIPKESMVFSEKMEREKQH